MTELEYVKSSMTDMESLKSAISDLEYMKSAGDSITGFVPTKKDLAELANVLADELVHYNFFLRLCVGLRDLDRRNYTSYRLGRILDYLPELRLEIEKKLQRGFQENDEAEMELEHDIAANPQNDTPSQ
jgi:hypothetical protein